MKDNLSLVITMIILVLLIVIFPLYNFFERQDDMSYNLVLKSTTMFADEIINSGYITQEMYDKFVSELANTGNIYDIQIEAHRKILTYDHKNMLSDTYVEQSYIDYTDDIFNKVNENTGVSDTNFMGRTLKNNIYTLNEKDEIYIRVKNSNITLAGAMFNAIIPTSKKTRISVNYGGIVKNNAWAKVDATYLGHKQAPTAPEVYLVSPDNSENNLITNTEGVYEIEKTKIVDDGYFIIAKSNAFEGNSVNRYMWKITNKNTLKSFKRESGEDGKLTDTGYNLNDVYTLEVYAIDNQSYKSENTSIDIKIIDNEDSSEITVKKGDIDNNGIIDTLDQTLLQNYLDNTATFSSVMLKSADVNDDQVVDKKDLELIIELINNEGYILGDVNADLKIDINDLTMVQDSINGVITLSDEEKKRADMNGDDVIDLTDLSSLSDKMNK